MIKSINQWSFPADMTAKACLLAAKRAGFEGFEPFLYHEHGALIRLFEIIGRICYLAFPAQPSDVAYDGIDVLVVFLLGIGIVETQMTTAIIISCQCHCCLTRIAKTT